MSAGQPDGALRSMLVLDLAQLITGPWCASLLGDLGAEVIKVEPPPHGEAMRHIGPEIDGQAMLFLAINRNKRSLTLDLGDPKGREVLDGLIARADVLIQNFRPDVRRAYRLEYEDVRRVRPDIVYLSVTAFGEDGPYRLKPGTDHVFQGLSGLMSVTGGPGAGPMRCGIPAADMTAALLSLSGVLAALLHRQRTGKGQKVEINLLDAAMSLQQTTLTEFLLSGTQAQPTGNSSPFACPVSVFATRDGNISISAFSQKFWRGLCRALELEDLTDDPRFADAGRRMAHREELEALLSVRLAHEDSAHWLARLEAADVPCGPVHDYASLLNDPQVRRNGLISELAHDQLGTVRTLGNPLGFSATPARPGAGAPLVGADTGRILSELGIDAQRIKQLSDDGVI